MLPSTAPVGAISELDHAHSDPRFPFSIGAFITQRRCLTPNVTDPGPKDLIRARRKLSTVTACSTVSGPGSGGVHPSSERGHHEQGEGGRDVEPDATQCSTEEW